MSLNDDLLMEFLDEEIPTQYIEKVRRELENDRELYRKYESFLHLRKAMHVPGVGDGPNFQESKERVRFSLEWSFRAAEHKQPESPFRRSIRRIKEAWNNVETVMVPVAVLVATFSLLIIFSFMITFSDSTIGPDPQETATAVNFDSYTDLDPNLINLLAVNNSRISDQPMTLPSNGSEGFTGDASGGIDFQINVQDVEQLLKLLEGARNLHADIGEITIQLPGENQFQLLGESQLKRASAQEDK